MKRSASGRHLPPSRMDQHVAIEMATGSSATTRLKNALGEQGVAPLNRRGAKHYAPARRHRGVDHPQTVCRNVLDLVRHQCIKRPVKTHIVPHQIEEASLSPEGGVAAERHVDQKILRWLQPGWISAMLSQKGYSTRFGYFTRTAKNIGGGRAPDAGPAHLLASPRRPHPNRHPFGRRPAAAVGGTVGLVRSSPLEYLRTCLEGRGGGSSSSRKQQQPQQH